MSSFKLGKRSTDNLNTCHSDLQILVREAIKYTRVDFTVIEGKRSTERQQMLFNTKKSQVNPSKYTPEILITKGKHIVNEFRSFSDAFDFIAYVPGKPKLAFDLSHLFYLVGVFISTGERLYAQGEMGRRVRSGINWDMDGELRYDQKFLDAPHIELI